MRFKANMNVKFIGRTAFIVDVRTGINDKNLYHCKGVTCPICELLATFPYTPVYKPFAVAVYLEALYQILSPNTDMSRRQFHAQLMDQIREQMP